MPGHNNAEISRLGRTIFAQCIKDLGWSFAEDDSSPTGYYITVDGENTPCKVYTKRHEEIEGYRMTGRNQREILQFMSIQKYGSVSISIFFIDAALGCCYGETLDKLMTETHWGGKTFPILRDTHKGKVYFFNVETMPTLFKLTAEQTKQLVELIADNKSDKYQQKLF